MPNQIDLFELDSPLLTEVRGERSLMAFPFFALSKGKWTKTLAYKTDKVSIEIVPTAKGVATIYDKEIVLYIASLMVRKLEAGKRFHKIFILRHTTSFALPVIIHLHAHIHVFLMR